MQRRTLFLMIPRILNSHEEDDNLEPSSLPQTLSSKIIQATEDFSRAA